MTVQVTPGSRFVARRSTAPVRRWFGEHGACQSWRALHRRRRDLMAAITYDRATLIYPGATRPSVDALDLSIADGEFLVLVGPSGCGKSTSLRMLAGLEEVTDGSIHIGDEDVTRLPPKERDIAMVFQNYALYPHMTVADNMGFAL